ncbi:MAG: dTMP kinase [Alphaproteobacteria bacterium]|nr:dTMP kinase [Alphaproteobacteria bacterium]
MAARGKFIVLEGGEGAGKSTQIARLAEALGAAGKTVALTREPGGSPGAEEIRKLLVQGATDRWAPMSEALLHYAARRDHVTKTIEPALAAGTWVISDRFSDSTMAYQGHGQGIGREAVETLHRLVLGNFQPDLALILDLPVARGLARAKNRGGDDRYERMGAAFHEALRAAFLEIAARAPGRCAVIDADATPDIVAGRIRAAVRERLGV